MKIPGLAKEPLFHFLAIGAAIFGAHGLVADPGSVTDRDRIVVTAGDVERLASFWKKRRLRQPSPEELDGLVAEFVREEVLYREALALGLDRDDAVVRRLLRQKYEFLTQDLAVPDEPEAADLVAFYEANHERYRTATTLSFTQVFFDTDRRGADGEREALVVLASLRDGGTTAAAVPPGDARLLEAAYLDRSLGEITALFGEDFAESLADLGTGVWSGPVRSGYGLHLVRIDARRDGDVPPFEQVADRVHADWTYQERRQADEAIYRRLLERYDVVVDATAAAGAKP